MRRRLTIRARLTLSYAGMVTGSVAVFIVIVYFFLRYVPMNKVVEQLGGPGPTAQDYNSTGPHGKTTTIGIQQTNFLEVFLVISAIALVVLAILGGTVGWLVAGRIIKPLVAINDAATRAATGTLDHRVGLDGPHDEVRELADTFDRMLGSLERSFAIHRRFAANASHELRTPLATTQTMIDVALADPDTDTEELRELAGRVREMNVANIETVDALLDLADADSGARTREPVDLAELSGDVARELADEASAAGVDLAQPSGAATAFGDPVLVRQAVSNLVRNAIRHNVPGGHASVSVSQADSACVVVTNTGKPVPPESVDSLVEPFVRGSGRVRGKRGVEQAGHGLGLAIVAAVAVAHDGSLRLYPNPDGGLTVRLDLPHADGNS